MQIHTKRQHRKRKHLWSSSQTLNWENNVRNTKTWTKPMEGTLRCTLGSQAQHPDSLEDHIWYIQQSTSTHTKHIHNIQQPNSNHTQTHCELFHQIIHKTLSNTQNTRQTDPLTEHHIQYKDMTSHSQQLRPKRQYNKVRITTNKVLTN